jgi:hypothetical protein
MAKSNVYEATHYEIFSSLLLLPVSEIKISSAVGFQVHIYALFGTSE